MKSSDVDTAAGCIVSAWLIYFVLILAFWVTIGYVVLHFVAKAW